MAKRYVIYGTKEQYFNFRRWLWSSRRDYVQYMYDLPSTTRENYKIPLAYFPYRVNIDIYKSCPLQFVKDAINEQHKNNDEYTSETHLRNRLD